MKDFLSAVLDVTIVKPIIEAIVGKDLITQERLTDSERSMKLAGVVVDLFTLGQAIAVTKGLGLGIKGVGKVVALELISNAAANGVGSLGNLLELPLPLTWLLSVAAGCSVSCIGGKYIYKDVDGIVREISDEEVEVLLENGDELLKGKNVDELFGGKQ